MGKAKLILFTILTVVIALVWFLIFETLSPLPEKAARPLDRSAGITDKYDSYLDVIIFSSFPPLESEKLSEEILKYAGKNSAVRVLSANHLSTSYSGQEMKSLGFYLSTVLTNTEKSTLTNVCSLLSASFAEYQRRDDSTVTRIFLLGSLPEALNREDPALYCISNFTKELKSTIRKDKIEYFTYIKSEDTANPLDKDLINLLSGNNYNVSIIMIK